MAHFEKNDKGFSIIKLSRLEWMAVMDGHLGTCDLCDNNDIDYGYIIPVIPAFYCETCYKAWLDSATRYKSDIEIETQNFRYFVNELRALGVWEENQ